MASSSSSCNYDVFLNFRGEDTRKSFTCHLYDNLYERKKIKTFIDDEELRRGDQIPPALLNAIQSSKISVIIFSKHYASSKWCLNELIKILECKNMKGQIMIPVFYEVSPSNVRHQTGTFGGGFDKLEQQLKEKPEMVQKWRDALIETSHLAGLESTKFRHDAQLVDKIVEVVLKKLEKVTVPTDSSNGLVGLNSRIEQIKPFLCMDLSDTVQIVGIWGMGGIGKTTLATAIFNQFSCEFEGRCFLSDVRRNSETGVGLEHLQKQFLSTILSEKLEVAGPNIPQFTKGRVRRMKVLIVLDDVNKVGQLEGLIGGLDQYGPGSRIVVTTRDKGVLKKFGVEEEKIYGVNGMDFHEAFEHFCNFAFKEKHCPEDFKPDSWKVVRYASGNPLVLKVLGSSLKSKRHWGNVLDDLNRICEFDIHDIYDILKISLNELTRKEKSIFLDIACFFEGEDKGFVTRILDDSGSYGLDVLVDKSLITVSNNCLQMHDLLREMGQEIVHQESEEEPGKRSRLWDPKEIRRVLKHNKGTEVIEGILLNLSKMKDINLGSEVFTKMSTLRLLKFYIPESSGILDMSTKVQLPDGLDYLPEKLRYFHWHNYPLRTLPYNFKPKNLVELNLPYSKVVQIWEGKKKAFQLKSVDLHDSQSLIRMPDLSETPNLERINLLNCTNLACIPSSIQNFNYLSFLCFKGCQSLRSFPNNLHFVSPVAIDFSSCVNLTEFPHISGNITDLQLPDTAIEEVPSSIQCLTNLGTLNLMLCRRLKRVSNSVFKLKSLHSLYFKFCFHLESLPEGLETQGLDGCSKLDKLPDNIGNLKSFEYIGAHGSATSQLPSSAVYSNKLKNLSFSGCRGLVSLPTSSLSGLSSLEKLVLSDCALTAIPQEICCLSSLERLWLNGNDFESLPASIKQLSRLESLDLSHCNKLESLPELPLLLKWLNASDCNRLQSLPEIPSCLEELDESVLEKLSKYSRENNSLTDSPSIKFFFSNCLKLINEEANKKNLADSQLRIQHMAIASLRLFKERSNPRHPKIILLLPGSEIPEWFSNQSSGSEITLQLPQHCWQNLIGFAFCAVASVHRFYKPFEVNCICIIEISPPPKTKIIRHDCCVTGSGCSLPTADHVILGFRAFESVGFPDDNHHTTVSFKFYSKSNAVKCCGVCPVYANPNVTKPNTFALNFATQNWKLDDMASASGTSASEFDSGSDDDELNLDCGSGFEEMEWNREYYFLEYGPKFIEFAGNCFVPFLESFIAQEKQAIQKDEGLFLGILGFLIAYKKMTDNL